MWNSQPSEVGYGKESEWNDTRETTLDFRADPLPRTEVQPANSTVDVKEEEEFHPLRKYMFLSFGILSLVAIALGVGFGLAASSLGGSPTPAPAGVASFCDFTDQVQPDVREQCSCSGTVSVISNDTMVRYNSLQTGLGLALPNMTSCQPETLSLLLLATASNTSVSNEVLINRYVLNLLYLSMVGGKWVKRWMARSK